MAAGGFSEDQWEIRGESPGRRYIVQFKGAEGLAARHVQQAFTKLRLDNGAWRRFEATTPAGARTSLFISLDKNAQM
eukprot:6075617-Pyramimonas_sp.AAC.1